LVSCGFVVVAFSSLVCILIQSVLSADLVNKRVCYAELAVERYKTTEAQSRRGQSFTQWLPTTAD